MPPTPIELPLERRRTSGGARPRARSGASQGRRKTLRFFGLGADLRPRVSPQWCESKCCRPNAFLSDHKTCGSPIAVGTSVTRCPHRRIRTCDVPAYGSGLGCLALISPAGQGRSMRATGRYCCSSFDAITQAMVYFCPPDTTDLVRKCSLRAHIPTACMVVEATMHRQARAPRTNRNRSPQNFSKLRRRSVPVHEMRAPMGTPLPLIACPTAGAASLVSGRVTFV
jgi:hypothetical protein